KTISETEQKLKAETQTAAQAIKEAQTQAEQKIRAYAERAARAEEKTQAEAKARADAEQRANMEAQARLEAERNSGIEAPERAKMQAKLNELTKAIEAAEQNAKAEPAGTSRIEAEGQTRETTEPWISEARPASRAAAQEPVQPKTPPVEIISIPTTTATCECCGRENILQGQAVRIDSGQVFCQDCFRALSGSSLV
ncbi:MAG: hypothetical protein ACYST6_14945, partial [Planctomycetota bacterium]